MPKGIKGFQKGHKFYGDLSKPNYFQKGHEGYWAGKRRPDMTEENHPAWKGDDVGYCAKHDWVEKYLGKPTVCWSCGDEEQERYEWANKSGWYKRDLDDWIRLCVSCHRRYDA